MQDAENSVENALLVLASVFMDAQATSHLVQGEKSFPG